MHVQCVSLSPRRLDDVAGPLFGQHLRGCGTGQGWTHVWLSYPGLAVAVAYTCSQFGHLVLAEVVWWCLSAPRHARHFLQGLQGACHSCFICRTRGVCGMSLDQQSTAHSPGKAVFWTSAAVLAEISQNIYLSDQNMGEKK